MRVVAGTARGRRLEAPPGSSVRPTTDRVRESVFNSLGSSGLVVDAAVLDLFAGTGALGIEALSRGARRATFVERDRVAADTVRANLERTGLADRSQVVGVDAIEFVRRTASAGADDPYDLVLLDPPYAFDGWPALLAAVGTRWPGACVVAESDRPLGDAVTDSSERLVTVRRYGTTVVTIFRAAEDQDRGDDPDADGPD